MSVAAALLSIALFLAFASAGLQKMVFNPAMSKAAEHLGFSKRGYQRVGVLEVLGAIALLIGLTAHRSSALGIVNEVAAGCLVLLMLLAALWHVRHGDRFVQYAPALGFAVLTALELVFRVA